MKEFFVTIGLVAVGIVGTLATIWAMSWVWYGVFNYLPWPNK